MGRSGWCPRPVAESRKIRLEAADARPTEDCMTSSVRARSLALAAAALWLAGSTLVIQRLHAQAPAAPTSSVRALFSQGSMNVYRRFVPEQRARMIDFYDKVLTLR